MAQALIDVGDGTLILPPPKTPAAPLPPAAPAPSLPPAESIGGVPVAQAVTIATVDASPTSAPPVSTGPAATEELGGVSAAQAEQIATDYGLPAPDDGSGSSITVGDVAAIDDLDESAEIADANDPDLTDLEEWDFEDPFGVQLLSADNQPLKGGGALSAITQACSDYGVDPLAAIANAIHEGAGGTVGDGGIAYGPFQDHLQVAGRPFAGVGTGYDPVINAWAWGVNGIRYCVRAMVNGSPSAKGLTGHAAVYAIVYGFEKPGEEAAAYKTRAAEYDHLVKLGSGWAAYAAPLFAGPVTGGAVDTTPITQGSPVLAPSPPAGVVTQWRGLVDVFAKEIPAEGDNVGGLSQSLVGVFK